MHVLGFGVALLTVCILGGGGYYYGYYGPRRPADPLVKRDAILTIIGFVILILAINVILWSMGAY